MDAEKKREREGVKKDGKYYFSNLCEQNSIQIFVACSIKLPSKLNYPKAMTVHIKRQCSAEGDTARTDIFGH
jgi:hypothetical protein